MVVYVDDMLLLAPPQDIDRRWQELQKSVQSKDPAAPLQRYPGALYHFDAFDPKKPNAPRSLMTSIEDYASNAVRRFKAKLKDKLTHVTSPYFSAEEIAVDGHSLARFSSSAASHVATLLFLSRVARLDISVAVQRLCRIVTKWTTTHDV